MDVVDVWTGRRASFLRTALRMTNEAFAAKLGTAVRTVAKWNAEPDVVPGAELQRALDTLLQQSTKEEKTRFALLSGQQAVKTSPDHAAANSVPFTVAIAIVVADEKVLIVCRRDAGPSGITWQFPAGIVKPGASASTVAVQETLTETGVHCSVRERLGERLHPLSGVRCEYYLCDYLAGEVENRDATENIDVIWVARRDLARFIPHDTVFPPILRALGVQS